MAKIDPKLEQRLQDMPNRAIDLIVRTAGDPSPHLDWLAANDIEVKQVFKLSPGVAVSCPGRDALKLLNQDWVVSVELDEAVRAV
ncbi:MAG TPA: hypothetical protein VEC96_00355 [Anaerolineae bacterium]|nr:hypothetical protein [Anaerolineae bacterium]HXV99406.1 hypothetical protein [Anaerolineae bacterium]